MVIFMRVYFLLFRNGARVAGLRARSKPAKCLEAAANLSCRVAVAAPTAASRRYVTT